MPDKKPIPLTQRRRRRIPADKVRDLMLEEARRMVATLGMTASLEDLSMEDVIAAAGVPRGSVYRIWPYRDDFIGDLLVRMAGPDWFGTAALDMETLDLVVRTLAQHDRFDTPKDRRRAVLKAVRLAAERNFSFLANSADWKVYIALIATSGGSGDPKIRSRVADALARSDARFTTEMAKFYELVSRFLGLRLRDSYTFEHLAVAGAAVVEGLALRRLLVETADETAAQEPTGTEDPLARLRILVTESLPGPSTGEDDKWSLAALGFLGVLDRLIEPAPEAEYNPPPFKDLEQALDNLRKIKEAKEARPT